MTQGCCITSCRLSLSSGSFIRICIPKINQLSEHKMQLWPLCQHWHPGGGLQVCLHCMDLLTLLHFGGVQNLVAQTYAMHGFMYVACTPELWAPSCMHSRLTLSHTRLAHASKDNGLVMLSISSSRSSSKLLSKMTRRTLQASIALSSAIFASSFDYVTCLLLRLECSADTFEVTFGWQTLNGLCLMVHVKSRML